MTEKHHFFVCGRINVEIHVIFIFFRVLKQIRMFNSRFFFYNNHPKSIKVAIINTCSTLFPLKNDVPQYTENTSYHISKTNKIN